MKIEPNKESIKEHWTALLQLIGENVNRPGIRDTPSRIAAMYEEVFRGYNPRAKPQITLFPNGQDGIIYNQMIIDEGMFYSFCEHHGIPFFGKYWFSYIPHAKGSIIGLSKVTRLVHYHSSRLQIQERLVKDIIDDFWNILAQQGNHPRGMALVMKAKHLCKSMRGTKSEGEMTTIELRGLYKNDAKTRQEFFNFVNGG